MHAVALPGSIVTKLVTALVYSIYVSHRSRHVKHTMFINMTLSLTSFAICAHAASEKRHATCCAALSTITRQQDSISQAHACLASAHLPLSTLHAACIDNMHARLHFVLYKRRGRHALAHGACICDTPPELHNDPAILHIALSDSFVCARTRWRSMTLQRITDSTPHAGKSSRLPSNIL